MLSEKILTTILNGGDDNATSDKNDGDDDIYLLLIGNHQSGKTSIAFNLAYHIALNGGKPLYICNQIKLEGKLPLIIYNSDQHIDSILMHHNTTTNIHEKKKNNNSNNSNSSNSMLPEVLQRINMKYITTIQDLKTLIAGLHLFEPRPSIVIIDDLSILIDPLQAINRSDSKFLEIVLRLTSYLQDAMKFLATIPSSSSLSSSSRRSTDINATTTTTSIANNVNDIPICNVEDNNNSSSSSTARRSDRCSDVSRLKVIITDSCREKLYLQLLSKTMTTILSLQTIDHHHHHHTSTSSSLHGISNRASTVVAATVAVAATSAVSLTLLKATDYHLCDAATTFTAAMMSPTSSSNSTTTGTGTTTTTLWLHLHSNSLYVISS